MEKEMDRFDKATSSDHEGIACPVPSKSREEEAFRYVTRWLKASRDFVSRKLERWKLLEDLYHNRRDLNSWGARSVLTTAQNRIGLRQNQASERERWQADIILSPSYIVDTWADRAYQAIFSGPEWLTVVPEAVRGQDAADIRFPTSFKLQELLLSRLAQGQIHVRMYEMLQHVVLFGSVYAKIFWYSKTVARHRWDFETLDVIGDEERIYDCPIVQVIPLDRLLPDWTATHGDVQRHTGIGHRVDKTYDHIVEQFNRGVYNLNRSEFFSRWGDSVEATGITGDELLHDADADDLEADLMRRFTVWEWHGRIPSGKGSRECVCTIVTDRAADSPENGVMVRLTDSPVLWCGLRPFLAAHYTPMPGPFGVGAVESNLDLIHAISQFLSQSQDNARLTANAQIMVRRGSSAARQISTENDAVYPGKVWTVDDPGDVLPFPPLNFPQEHVNHLIDYLNVLLERRTAISEMTRGIEGRQKTATEATILQDAAMGPFATRTDIFARTFLEGLGRIALAMVQQFVLEDQTITVRGANGVDQPIPVTPEEIQAGRFRVVATITRTDATRVAKAQSIERILPTLAQFEPLLQREGLRISFAELFKRYLDLIGVDGVDRVLTRMDPAEAVTVPPDPNGRYMAAAPAADLPPQLVEHGGPIGPEPTDANAIAQMLQMQANGAR